MIDAADFDFRSHYFTVNHGQQSWKMHYIDEGATSKEEQAGSNDRHAIVAVHGNPTWSYFFRSVVERFSGEQRVIVPDHLGCGLSDKPQVFPYSLKVHIDHLEQLIEHLELDRVTLVVHDWGGAIGLGWAVRHPEKIEKLVICNTAAFYVADVPKRIAILRTPWLGEWAMRGLNAFAWPATFMASHKGLPRQVRCNLVAPYNSWKNRIAVARFVQDIPMSPCHPTYEVLADIESRLVNLTGPKLLLWGMRDFCFHPGFLKRWSTLFPQANVVTFENAGHYLFEDDPSGCNDAIASFLKTSYTDSV